MSKQVVTQQIRMVHEAVKEGSGIRQRVKSNQGAGSRFLATWHLVRQNGSHVNVRPCQNERGFTFFDAGLDSFGAVLDLEEAFFSATLAAAFTLAVLAVVDGY